MKLILLILTISLSVFAFAETESALTLPAAIQKGLSFSPEVRQAESVVHENQEKITGARGALFPTVNGKVSATTRQNSTTAATVSNSTGGNSSEVYNAALEFTQPLYTGGSFSSGLNTLKVDEEIARQSYFKTKQDQTERIIIAYYELVKMRQLLRAAEENEGILSSYLGITSRYEKIGRLRSTDRMQASVNHSLSLIDIEQVKTNLSQKLQEMRVLLGVGADVLILPQFEITIPSVNILSEQEALKTALTNNPAARVAELKVERTEYAKEYDLSTDMPSLNLSGAAGYQSPDRPRWFESTSQYYAVGLNLTVPLFSGLTSFSKRRLHNERFYQAVKEAEVLKNSLRATIPNLLSTLRSLYQQLKITQTAATQSREALNTANKGYQSGTVSSSDILNLQRSRYETEKLFIQAQINYLENLVALRKSLGIDLEKAYAK